MIVGFTNHCCLALLLILTLIIIDNQPLWISVKHRWLSLPMIPANRRYKVQEFFADVYAAHGQAVFQISAFVANSS